MFDESTVKAIAGLAKRAAGVTVQELHPGKKLVGCDGAYVEKACPVPARRWEANDLTSFAEAAAQFNLHQVWLAADRFVALSPEASFDDGFVIYKPKKSPIFAWLEKGQHKLAQEDLLLLLKTTFRHAYTPAGLLELVRSVKVQTNSTFTAEQQAANSKMGREVLSEATGAKELPAEIFLTTTVYDDFGDHHDTTAFTLNYTLNFEQPPKFLLTAVPSEIDQAVRAALEYAAAQIVEHDASIAVYRGRPLRPSIG